MIFTSTVTQFFTLWVHVNNECWTTWSEFVEASILIFFCQIQNHYSNTLQSWKVQYWPLAIYFLITKKLNSQKHLTYFWLQYQLPVTKIEFGILYNLHKFVIMTFHLLLHDDGFFFAYVTKFAKMEKMCNYYNLRQSFFATFKNSSYNKQYRIKFLHVLHSKSDRGKSEN